MTANTDSHESVSVTLDSSEQAAVEARALVDELPLSLSLEQRYDVRLALSELVANSVLHGSDRTGAPVDIRITASAGSIRCEVSDQGPGFRLVTGRPSVTRGLGLVIVDRLASRWGTDRGGRSVWFELDKAS